MSERVGVYVCHCGTNIAGVVDVESLAGWAKENLPGVTVARDYKFMCSSLGQELIQEDIRKEGLTLVVIAASSPHLHEKTFRNTCANAGLNPYLCHMASLREQVTWVTENKALAEAKARALIAGGGRRPTRGGSGGGPGGGAGGSSGRPGPCARRSKAHARPASPGGPLPLARGRLEFRQSLRRPPSCGG